MKLVIITEIIAPYRIPVFNALAQLPGIDLHVVFLAENDPGLRQWTIYKDEIAFSYQVLPSKRFRLGSLNFLFNTGVTDALRQASPDAVICGGYNYAAAWQVQKWARRNHVPFLTWVESTGMDRRSHNGLLEALKARFLRHCDGYVAAGKSSAQYLAEFGIDRKKIFFAPDAVDNDFFISHSDAARSRADEFRTSLNLPARYFLFTGRMVREKGVFDLLEAYTHLDSRLRDQLGLVMCGEGTSKNELERISRQVTSGQIVFTGFYQREKLAVLYALAEAFVFPTHSDPWGLVVNEAMACGLPIITTSAAGCAADLVDDGCNGRIVAPKETYHLAAAMAQLAVDPILRADMGAHSRRRISDYSPAKCAGGMATAAELTRNQYVA